MLLKPPPASPLPGCPRFGVVLDWAIRNKGWWGKDLAARAGVSPSFISNLVCGIRRPPIDLIQPWADLLDLHGEHRARFIIAAHLTHCTPPIVALVTALVERPRAGAAEAIAAAFGLNQTDVEALLSVVATPT